MRLVFWILSFDLLSQMIIVPDCSPNSPRAYTTTRGSWLATATRWGQQEWCFR